MKDVQTAPGAKRMFDPDLLLADLAQKKPRVLFYPSCGTRLEGLFDLNYDIFVLADYGPNGWRRDPSAGSKERREAFFEELRAAAPRLRRQRSTVRTRVCRYGRKWVFLFFQDNNEVFKRIVDAGLSISCFVGVNDGCAEGGNYECVNKPPWLKKVFAAMKKEGGLYVTDHAFFYFNREFFLEKWHISPVTDRRSLCREVCPDRPVPEQIPYDLLWPFPLGHMFGAPRIYRVAPRRPSQSVKRCNRLLISLEHDSIANHVDELDAMFVTRQCLEMMKACGAGPEVEKKAVLWYSRSAEYFTRGILDMAATNRLRTVGTIAYGNGDHRGILDVAREWTGEYPERLRIFYLESGDFADIIPGFSEEGKS